jgi:hypothetical protein
MWFKGHPGHASVDNQKFPLLCCNKRYPNVTNSGFSSFDILVGSGSCSIPSLTLFWRVCVLWVVMLSLLDIYHQNSINTLTGFPV